MAYEVGVTNGRPAGRPRPSQKSTESKSRLCLLLIGLLVVVFLTGGGSRADIASLIVLRPVSVVLLFLGLATLTREQIVQFRWLFLLSLAVLTLSLLHIIPLPPSLWQALPGREVVVEIDQLANLQNAWRPLTLDPPGAINALWSLAVPLAVLVLAAQIAEQDHRHLLHVLLALGFLSAFVGVLQLMAGPHSPLYLYRITTLGLPVGLFANRNHQAVLLACLVPLATVWLRELLNRGAVSDASRRALLFGFACLAAFLIVLTIVTGSRAGLMAMAFAVPASAWIYGGFDRPPLAGSHTPLRSNARRVWVFVLSLVPLGALALLATGLGRGVAIERLLGISASEDARGRIVPVAIDLTGIYSPLGSGLGSFEPVFKMHEPDALLEPTYVNHVHNDFLEVALTLGVPGILLMTAALVGMLVAGRRCIRALPSEAGIARVRASLVVLFLLAFASLWDYPLRVPSMQAIAVLAAVWLSAGRAGRRVRPDRSK